MEAFVKQQKEFLTIQHWMSELPSLTAGFTTKNGGFSEGDINGLNIGFHVSDQEQKVKKNRQHIAGKLAFPLTDWIGAEQTHDVQTVKVTSKEAGRGALNYADSLPGTDAFYTREKGILLTLCYADCVPLYFLHRQTKTIGIAHAGWKGTVNGIAEKMITKFNKDGIPVHEIEAVIGPSICGSCYVVNDRVITAAKHWENDSQAAPFIEVGPGQYKLDLKKLNQQIMMQSGLLAENIFISNYCTSCDSDLFYSHRRDGGKTGRMMSFIGWKEE